MENLTREIIEELNDVEPYCFKTDREEEIQKAIKTLQVYNCGYNGVFECSKHIDNDIQDAFYAGAKWADEHPKSQWISVNDDLPYNHSDLVLTYNDIPFSTKRVLVMTDVHTLFLCEMKKDDRGWIWNYSTKDKITHWFPIPEFPKE